MSEQYLFCNNPGCYQRIGHSGSCDPSGRDCTHPALEPQLVCEDCGHREAVPDKDDAIQVLKWAQHFLERPEKHRRERIETICVLVDKLVASVRNKPTSPTLVEKAALFDWLLTKFQAGGMKMDGAHHWVLHASRLPTASTPLEAIRAAYAKERRGE